MFNCYLQVIARCTLKFSLLDYAFFKSGSCEAAGYVMMKYMWKQKYIKKLPVYS